jgi:hypothetical protein
MGRESRSGRGWTPAHPAWHLGVYESILQKIGTGKRFPSEIFLMKMAVWIAHSRFKVDAVHPIRKQLKC